jgi:hypothetical protein
VSLTSSTRRRKDHPSFPSAITCCFLSSLKTLLMPREPIRASLGVNVPDFAMAGSRLTLYGRIWVIPEGTEGTGKLPSTQCTEPGCFIPSSSFSISSITRFIFLTVSSSGSSVVMSTPASFNKSIGYFEPPAAMNFK